MDDTHVLISIRNISPYFVLKSGVLPDQRSKNNIITCLAGSAGVSSSADAPVFVDEILACSIVFTRGAAALINI